MQVTLYTRRNCPLCDKAKRAIQSSGTAFELAEIDIDADPDLQRRFTDDVPVIFVNGREAFRHRGILMKDTHENTLRVAPPLVIKREEIDWAVERIAGVLKTGT